ncbi:hypothetical protein L249_6519 [Ophiocordyceps polyrhachis-furcata BCC 54312]|uniref:Glucose-methanol-choline oxidoreductase N-terminal domain-containing protein n=1 Tax=Ophiocordyceps polyrhachis-furcata BCC 54312 TaxID=1330021 RepID=A0A367LK79_9HYPO|nr:hypothetical protein L249_6519 [Ophiocordyceps polyrhachis-furcata BCC 54312]
MAHRHHQNPLRDPLQYAAKKTKLPVGGSPAYDYVIVGAGAAGCVLASRLSEDSSVSVLLLEAGGNNNVFRSKVPSLAGYLWGSKHDWSYETVSQAGVAGRRLWWPRGKMIGGSTSINAMMYHHCSASDFDEWASVYGCKGWSYDDIAPYFRRMESFHPSPSHPGVDLSHRGSDGRWHTGFMPVASIIAKGFIPACQQVGIPVVSDFNTPAGTLGASRFPSFVDPAGGRSSLATAFLSPDVMKRKNLYVAIHCHVSKVLLDGDGPTPSAVGVEFRGGQDCFQVLARREVILCAGAVNTPQILMLSGIGPGDHLEKHGIPVVRGNDAVGENMKDHLAIPVYGKAKKGQTMNYLTNPLRAILALLQWLIAGRGPLVSNFAEAAAFIKSTDQDSKAGPDLEIISSPVGINYRDKKIVVIDKNAAGNFVIGLRPQSKGSIKLGSGDPFDTQLQKADERELTAVIDPRYLTDEGDNDVKVLVTGLRLCIKILRSAAFSEFVEPCQNDDPWSVFWPYSSRDADGIPDEELISYLKRKAVTVFHPVGTARMGPSPSDSVVDLECRVHGVDGLRVIDASVFPEQISGHPCATVGAVAYKMSEMMAKRGGGSCGSFILPSSMIMESSFIHATPLPHN